MIKIMYGNRFFYKKKKKKKKITNAEGTLRDGTTSIAPPEIIRTAFVLNTRFAKSAHTDIYIYIYIYISHIYISIARSQKHKRTRPRWNLSFFFRKIKNIYFQCFFFSFTENDPSAGSPTETLLRLLLPLNDQIRSNFPTRRTPAKWLPRIGPKTSPNHPSVVATGGVYKGQGRNQRELVTRFY